jgi:hypothetical protein
MLLKDWEILLDSFKEPGLDFMVYWPWGGYGANPMLQRLQRLSEQAEKNLSTRVKADWRWCIL